MLQLRARDRRWLSSEVQSDLILVCKDGEVPAHSPLLASCSSLLSLLLGPREPLHSFCAGCTGPRLLHLPEVGVAECQALVDLLFTGRSTLPVAGAGMSGLLQLTEMLGVSLPGLALVTEGVRGQQVRPGTSYKFITSKSVAVTSPGNTCSSPFVSVRPPATSPDFATINTFVRPPPPNVEEQILDRIPVKNPLETPTCKKLPSKGPPEPPEPPSPQVILPDTVLSEVMGMMPGVGIKQEVEDSIVEEEHRLGRDDRYYMAVEDTVMGENEDKDPTVFVDNFCEERGNYRITEGEKNDPSPSISLDVQTNDVTPSSFPPLEGKDSSPTPSPTTSNYLSMDNTRNYVCPRCDQGFTFSRSFVWHTKRCSVETSSREENSSSVDLKTVKTVTRKTADDVGSNLIVPKENGKATEECDICRKEVTCMKTHLTLTHFKSRIVSDYCTTNPATSHRKQCPICRKPFKRLSGLVVHLGVQHGLASQYLVRRPGVGRKVSCGACVKCRMVDCGGCIPCLERGAGRGKVGGSQGVCVKKVCRNKRWSTEVVVSPSITKARVEGGQR